MAYSRAEVAFIYLGICSLLPYNCILTAQPYFDEHAFPGLAFPFTSMIAYSVCLCSSQVWLTFKGDSLSMSCRMGVAFVVSGLTCLALAVISVAGGGGSATPWYIPCLVIVAVLSVSNSLLQTGMLGVAGTIGGDMSAAAMLGMGVSGLVSLAISLLVQCIQKALNLDLESGSAGMQTAFVMFLACIFQILSSCWVYFVFLRSRIPETAEALATLEAGRCASASPRWTGRQNSRLFTRVKHVLKEVSPQAVNVWGVFIVTMAVFPGVMVHWVPSPQSVFANNRQLYGVLLIGCFQVGDVVGRYAAGWGARRIAPQRLWIVVLMRFIFIPMFMLGQRLPGWSPLWGSDAGRFALCAAFSVSNGFAASLAMMFGPQCVTDPEKKEVAGIAMSTVMVTGIFMGTLVAFATQIGIHASPTS